MCFFSGQSNQGGFELIEFRYEKISSIVQPRIIDRANNWYEETFRDRDTGEIVPPHKAEPLTEHRKPKAR